MHEDYPKAALSAFGCPEPDDVPKINTAPFGDAGPGTVKLFSIDDNEDGTWTMTFEYRPEGWKDDEP